MNRFDRSGFATTRWSIITAASDSLNSQSREALSQLCNAYWSPLYAYARRRGFNESDAQDETQNFFAMLLDSEVLANADQTRGRFRTYLLTVFQRFLSNRKQYQRALKRGGGVHHFSFSFDNAEESYRLEPVENVTAEQLFEKQWALTLLDRVLSQLKKKYADRDRLDLFHALQPVLSGASDSDQDYEELSMQLGQSKGALRVAAHRMRDQYRQLLRQEVAQTVEHEGEVDQELRQLMKALQS